MAEFAALGGVAGCQGIAIDTGDQQMRTLWRAMLLWDATPLCAHSIYSEQSTIMMAWGCMQCRGGGSVSVSVGVGVGRCRRRSENNEQMGSGRERTETWPFDAGGQANWAATLTQRRGAIAARRAEGVSSADDGHMACVR
jgi:hypothetical protein